MNEAKCYIKNIVYEKPYKRLKHSKDDRKYVMVKFEYICYGEDGEMGNCKRLYSEDEWNDIKSKGYFDN